MKKISALILFAAVMLGSSAKAQTKFGYIRVDEMVALMPELKKIDTLLASFQQDSLPRTYNYLLSQFQRYDSIASDTINQPVVVRTEAAKQRTEYLGELQNWQSTGQAMLEQKQNILLQPVYDKVLKAIDEVAKEKGYGFVFNKEALLVGPPADNLLPMVAEKLKVKLPANTPQSPAAQKPAPKTGN